MAQSIIWSGGKPYEYVDGALTPVQTPQTYTMPDGTKFTYGPDGTPQPLAAGQATAAPVYQGSAQGVPQWLIDQNPGKAISSGDALALGGNTSWNIGNQVYSGYQWDGEPGAAPWGSNTPGYYSYENTPAMQAAQQSGRLSQMNGSPYSTLDANGKVTGSGTWTNIQDSNKNTTDAIAMAIVGSIFGAGAMGALGGGAAAGAAEGGAAGAGAAGSGAGFVGEGAASGVGAWDGALAGANGGAAAGAGAGVTGFGDAGTMYGGADAASAASMGGGASVNGGAALGTGTAAMGAGGSGGGSGGGSSGTPPPSNPYSSGTSGFGGSMGDYDWSKLIGPALGLVNGAIGANAAGKASDAQLQAAREAQALLAPWRTQGEWAVNRLGTMLGKEGTAAAQAAFTTDPGYQFRQSEGEKGMQRAASAAGGLGAGKFLKDGMRFNQGLASQEFTNSTNRLANLAGLGQTSANSSADYATQGGNAVAAGTVGRANALTGALGQGYSMYQNQNQQDQNNALMRQLLGSRYAY